MFVCVCDDTLDEFCTGYNEEVNTHAPTLCVSRCFMLVEFVCVNTQCVSKIYLYSVELYHKSHTQEGDDATADEHVFALLKCVKGCSECYMFGYSVLVELRE